MANEAEKAIAVRLANAPTFHPVTADLFVNDWGLDAGDIVTVRSGETDYSVPIYNMSLDWRGSAMAQIQSTGNKERKPLSALKRKQYYGRSSSRRYTEEQGVIYDGKFEVTSRHVTSVLSATGVKLDINGNPEVVYNPETGEYEYVYDEHGGNLASKITQTAGEISAEVSARTAQGDSFDSRITQTATAITAEVTRATAAEGTLGSRITQTANNITLEVTRASQAEGELRSAISVNAEAITAKVSKGAVATQLSVECGNVHITGTSGNANLTVDGYVLASDLATDIADIELLNVQDLNAVGDATVGGYLTVYGDLSVALENTLTCGTVSCGNLDCEGISFNGGTAYTKVVTGWNISGNTLTLYSSDGTSENFSKATPLSASWSGLTYTIAASPTGTLPPFVTRLAMQTPTGTSVSCDVNLVEFTDPEDPTQTETRGSRTLYLKEKDGFFYITNTDADPTSGNTLAKKEITGGGSGSITDISAGGWTWTNNRYQNIVTATASDASSDSETVLLPTITCNANLGSSSNFSVYAYGPEVNGSSHIVSGTKNFYLKTSGNYIYATNTNADPVETDGASRNVVAKLPNPLFNPISFTGISSMAEYNSYTTGYTDVSSSLRYGGGYRGYTINGSGTVSAIKFLVPAFPGIHFDWIQTMEEYNSYTGYTDMTQYIGYGSAFRSYVVAADGSGTVSGVKFIVPPDRYADGQRSVTLSSSGWDWDDNNEWLYFKVDASAPNTSSVTVGLPLMAVWDSGSFDQNHLITVAAYGQDADGNWRIVTQNRTIDASSVYIEGQRSVTLSGGVWDYDDNNDVMYASVHASSPNTQSRVVYLPSISMHQTGSTMYVYAADGSGTTHEIARKSVSTSHSISCSSTVSSIGTNRGQRKNAGSISKSGLIAQTYLGFTISCGGTTQQFYITVNP